MRSLTFTASNNPLSLAWLFTITRPDGVVVRLVNTQRDVTASGHTFTAEPGLTLSDVQYYSDGTISNAQINIALRNGGAITPQDLALSRYQTATISMQIVNLLSPSLGTAHFTGYLGKITVNARGLATIEARGQLIKGATIVTEVYQAMDLAELGDFRNKIPILPPDVVRNTLYYNAASNLSGQHNEPDLTFMRARVGSAGNPSDYANLYWECTSDGRSHATVMPTYTGAVGDVITDGTAVFTARNAWLRYAQVGTIIDDFHFSVIIDEPRAVDGWFTQGQVIPRSGNGLDCSIEIRGWTQSGSIVFAALPISGLIAQDDWLEMIPGYDKTAVMASSKFNNIINFRGDPFAPAPGALLSSDGSSLTPSSPGATGAAGAAGPTLVPRETGITSPIVMVPSDTPFTL